MLSKSVIGTCLLLLSISTSLYANSALNIEGDAISYDHPKGIVTATGNVKITRENLTATANEFTFDYQNQTLSFPENVTFTDGTTHIRLDQFSYDMKAYRGHAHHMTGQIDRLYISSEEIELKPELVRMKNAQFTTCSYPHPHYLLTARQLYLYPQFGFFVALNNWFTNDLFPVPIWVPTYIYGSQKYSILSTPLPIIGSNKREGLYIKHKLGYFRNEKSTGTFDFGTSENLGFYIGFNHNQIIDKSSLINTQLHTTNKEGLEGSLSYIYSVNKAGEESPEPSKEKNLLSYLSAPKGLTGYGQWIAKVGFNELVFDSRIDALPEISFNKEPFTLKNSKIEGRYFTSIAKITENTHDNITHADTVAHFNGNLTRRFPLTEKWNLLTSLSHIGYIYTKDEPWQRTFSELTFNYHWPFLTPEFTYRKLFYTTGESPFDYQRIYSITEDEFGISLKNRTGKYELKYETNYSVKTGDPRTKQYSLTYYMHCWSIMGSYESVEKRMGFGFTFF